MRIVLLFSAIAVLLVATSLAYADDVSADKASADEVSFNRDIRGILSENCYHCHGPDEGARQADLRLDTEAGAKASVITSGKALQSELINRVTSDDPDTIMPPPESARSLTAEQIELLKQWVDQGAEYEAHWSFLSPDRAAPPKIDRTDLAENEIDHFVIAPLAAKGIEPAQRAARETLIRRVTFDLIGLPPTLEELDAFLSDESPDAYSKLIDRLLRREEFGERMASDWLDAARYSDTYGYQVDRDRFVWPWRDWVIRAFNDNMPYDRFITEQLAGDLLPDATRDQILATTFNRLHPQKVEGGSVPEEFRIEYIADRTQTVATAMMGLTFECCRCHDHKYDPLSQKEYYQLSAFFDNIDEAGLYSYFNDEATPTPALPLPSSEEEQRLADQQADVDQAEQALRRSMDMPVKPRADDKRELRFAKPIASLDFEEKPSGRNQSTTGVSGQAVQLTGDDPVSTEVGNFTRSTPFSVSLWMKTPDTKDRAVIFHRSRAWTDAASRGYQLLLEDGRLSWSLIHFWPGNAMRIRCVEPISVGSWVHVTVTNDGSSRASGLKIYVNGKIAETEIIRDSLTKNITGGGGDNIAIGERFRDNGFTQGVVDRFRVFDTELSPLEALRIAKHDESLHWLDSQTALQIAQARLISEHQSIRQDEVVAGARETLKIAREALCKTQDAVKDIMVMRELDQPKPSYLLQRGAYDSHGEAVTPATPQVLTPFPEDAPRNRLGLARWMTDRQHPLTSRVAVNRLWQLCFGTGLVRTPEDFGSQGRVPTHAQLLDWLAIDLMENGWDIKRALKQIMMSATYCQASFNPHADLETIDPENEWLARFPTYRLSAEMLRDNSLAVSGRLVRRVGGPPVKPYEVEASFTPTDRDKGDGLYRRSLYTYWKRTGPAPMMMALDAAKRDVCRVQRERTSSPLQAFVLLNGPQFVEAGRGLAERLVAQHGDNQHGDDQHGDNTPDMLHDAFRHLTSRQPSEQELAVIGDLYRSQLEYFQDHDEETKSFLAVGDAVVNPECNPQQLAAMTVVIGTLLSYDESVMKR